MKRLHLLGFLLCFSLFAEAQNIMQLKDKSFNYGAKVGFNASFPVINSLSVNGKEIDNYDIEYQVGYSAAVLCRINIKRFFIQPSIAWNRSEGKVKFSIPQLLPNTVQSNNTDLLKMRHNSLDIPVLVGYNLVKKAPYGLSILIGPKFKYNYKIAYTLESPESQADYVTNNTPLGFNIVTGVGVRIGRLFFDFLYEFGLNEMESDFQRKNILATSEQAPCDITIDKHTNQMGIALGFLF